MSRATTSVGPAAANGTIILTGRSGYPGLCAGGEHAGGHVGHSHKHSSWFSGVAAASRSCTITRSNELLARPNVVRGDDRVQRVRVARFLASPAQARIGDVVAVGGYRG